MQQNKGTKSARLRPRYAVEAKVEIVRFARANNVQAACQRFHAARSSVHLWMKQESQLIEQLRASLHSERTSGADGASCHAAQQTNEPKSSERASSVDSAPPLGAQPTTTPDSIPQEGIISSVSAPRVTLPTNPYATEAPSAPPPIICTPPANVSINHAHDALTRPTAGALTTTNSGPDDTSKPVLVGYQGAACGFACVAAQHAFAELRSTRTSPVSSFELTGYPQTSHLLDALHKHEVDLAFVATDELLSNTHHSALDRMVASRLKMVGEVVFQQDVSVCALPGTELCDVDCVVSDWATLQRCEEYIAHLEMQYARKIYRHVVWDSPDGCRLVQDERTEKTLVLCTATAATTYGLVVLRGRLPGSPTHICYAILARHGATSFVWDDPVPRPAVAIERSTLLVKGTARAILDIISAFAYRGLDIISFHTRGDEGQQLRSYVISYKASTDPLVEHGLHHHLEAAAERVIKLGTFTAHTLKSAIEI